MQVFIRLDHIVLRNSKEYSLSLEGVAILVPYLFYVSDIVLLEWEQSDKLKALRYHIEWLV